MLNLRTNTGLELLDLLAQALCCRIGQRMALSGAQSKVLRHRAFHIYFAFPYDLVAPHPARYTPHAPNPTRRRDTPRTARRTSPAARHARRKHAEVWCHLFSQDH